MGRVAARVSAENASGWSSAATWATIPADADARQVRRPVVEFAGARRGVGGKIAHRHVEH